MNAVTVVKPDVPLVIALSPQFQLAPQIAIAASRAGALGVLDLGIKTSTVDMAAALAELVRSTHQAMRWGLRYDLLEGKVDVLKNLAADIGLEAPAPVLQLAGVRAGELRLASRIGHKLATVVLLEVRSLAEASAAQEAGFDGVILKGNEAGGHVSRRSAFMLTQECAGKLAIPYWIHGGIGPYTAAAAVLAGAQGVVIGEQLWQTAEAPSAPANLSWSGIDGSETLLIGSEDAPYRCLSRSGRARLRDIERSVAQGERWQGLLLDGLLDPDNPILPAGADIGLAESLATRFGTVGRIVTAIRDAVRERLPQAHAQQALQAGAPLAQAHGTRFPVVQGPMTRVSDVAPFAKEVAAAGALPFVALAVLRGPEVASLLHTTRELMDGMPWGVGMLGFVPRELREEQLAVLREIKPPFAIIAGGRPSQARELEALGTKTYLHVPSPGLLRSFLDGGARRFVFEGSECGGHTGPRSSFVLWEQAVDILTRAELKDPENVHVLFAGGIHDDLSAAMVALIAAPLCARGMKVGVLMGTAYLFTHEIVASGAIVDEFQRQAVECEETTLLQSGVGIYTRCARTAFCDEFDALRRQLILESKSDEETLMALELMNIGRLRIASKGIARNQDPDAPTGQRYITLNADEQRRDGLYMLGDVARLRDRTYSLAELHDAVSDKSMWLLQERLSRSGRPEPAKAPEPIAVVGMAAHFPKAQGLQAYWHNIMRALDAVREVPAERWPAAQLFDARRGVADKIYSKWGGFLDDIPFDPQRYGIAPATLSSIEPAQLLTLEVARQALEDADLDQRPFARDRTACIVAVGGMNDLGTLYNLRTVLPLYLARIESLSQETRDYIVDTLFENDLPKWTEDSFPGILGNVIAGRVANRLDLGGSNFTVDAACASSLAALEVGFRQLRDGQADVALVAGVDCTNSALGFMCFAQTHALSPRGRSRPFDESADGIAISEGVGAIVLKRLSDAERDGDRIYALINGVGSASDGRHRSLTAPHPPGQVAALERAYDDAGVDPHLVTLIEAHGTGTALGDKSEIAALTTVMGSSETPACAIGSVKSMIGHTKVTAGIAGLIKAALALHHRVLPPTLGVERPVAALNAAGTSLYINSEARPWLHLGRSHPRYCGVSAFGFGGTNFHAVLSEYTGAYRPADKVSLQPREVELFAFAGADRREIETAIEHLLEGLRNTPQIGLAQLAYSLYREQHVLRRANGGQPCRLVVAAASVDDLVRKLTHALAQFASNTPIHPTSGLHYRESTEALGSVCFLFPGQGSQRINMLRDLVTDLPGLHACFAQPAAEVREQAYIAEHIYPRPAFSDAERNRQQQTLNATDVAQPALGMVDMAAFDVLTSYGLLPDFLAGHSYGEYAALCASGVITREALLHLSLARGRLAMNAPPGAMAALDVDGEQANTAISRKGLQVTVANLNAPDQTIIAGTMEAVEAALPVLVEQGMRAKRLAVSTAFHCPHMNMVGAALAEELKAVPLAPARVPVYANLTAAPYPVEPEQMRALLVRHISEPVRFTDQVEALYAAGARVFIECGPGLTLTGLVGRILGPRPHSVLAIDAPGRNGWVQLAQLLAQAEAIGLPINLGQWFAGRGLAEQGLDETLAHARRRTEHGPLIWRVNGGRAKPWAGAAPRSRTRQPKPAADSTPATPRPGPVPDIQAQSGASPVHVPQDTTPSHYRRTTMTSREPIPDDLPDGAAVLAPIHPAYTPEMGHFHNALTSLLAFQTEQQQVLRQFLDLQAQMVGIGSRAAVSSPLTLPPGPTHPGHPVSGMRPQTMRLPGPVAAPRSATPTAIAIAASMPVQAPVLPELPAQAPQALPVAAVASPSAAAQAARPVAAAPASSAEFSAQLLKAVSERTGYPIDMLDMDAHMEADLGIDSIKRIEIFSNLSQRHSLVGERDEEKLIEELSGFKTLREVVSWYEQLLAPEAERPAAEISPKKAPAPLSSPDEEVESHETPAESDPVLSYVVQACSAPLLAGATLSWPDEFPIVLVGKPSSLATALREMLEERGYLVRHIVPGLFTRSIDVSHVEVDLSSLDAILPLADLLSLQEAPPGALINLMGHGEGSSTWDHKNDARALFMLLKVFGPGLRRSASAGAGRLINVTSFDGRFGLDGGTGAAVGSAGTLGVAKSAAREWADIRVKCIDAAPTLDPGWLAAQITREMFSTNPDIEIGLVEDARYRIDLVPRNIDGSSLGEFALEPGSVVLVTGGAYGITANLARMLADKYHPRLVLAGRSALPGEEEELSRNVTEVKELRQLLTDKLQAQHEKVTPAVVETELKRLLKEREILANLAAFRAHGCEVEYHCLDVRDSKAFNALIEDVYQRLGRIDGVIHGAGVISDKLILNKAVATFDTVFDTKVVPALTLATRLDMASLRFIVFLSSVAGRFGNIGQADYSAANEVLNKLAGQLSHAWPHLHALSINWGPWDGGMVNDDLRRLYASRSIQPIAATTGQRYFLDELEHGPSRQPEIVISSSIGQIAALRLTS
jgi:acyl transferase domain-containing protein/NAD(P)H-dependent flavin oxidoreductase YrpB (nitropropane dioxygenase family)/NAD(P)-dependent dehydrogenase (short-subunit alcohol dehydrogenase family)